MSIVTHGEGLPQRQSELTGWMVQDIKALHFLRHAQVGWSPGARVDAVYTLGLSAGELQHTGQIQSLPFWRTGLHVLLRTLKLVKWKRKARVDTQATCAEMMQLCPTHHFLPFLPPLILFRIH